MKTNTPNPLIPQGTFPPHRKSHVRIAVFSILALHLILLGALLLQGCKRTTDSGTMQQTNASMTPEFDQPTNLLAVAAAIPPATIVEPDPMPPTPPAIVVTPPPLVTPTPGVTRTTPHIPAISNHPAEPAGTTTHVVLKHETFSTIAPKYGVTTKALAKANPKVDARSLKVGQALTIPAPAPAAAPRPAPGNIVSTAEGSVYVVKSGDNLTTIAKHFGTTVAALRSANSLKTDSLKVGDKLKIPAAARADSSTASAPRYP